MRLLFYFVALIFCQSCRVSSESLAGTYRASGHSTSRLILQPDMTYELAFLDAKASALYFPGQATGNCYTTGHWKLVKRTVLLQEGDSAEAMRQQPAVQDSIARFTSISSFNFWNRYGDPIPIRYILIASSTPKPHFGNSLYFFAQDFNPADTIRFYFDGYAPVSYPGTIAAAIGNNLHKITLREPYRAHLPTTMVFRAGKNRLTDRKRMTFQKKK